VSGPKVDARGQNNPALPSVFSRELAGGVVVALGMIRSTRIDTGCRCFSRRCEYVAGNSRGRNFAVPRLYSVERVERLHEEPVSLCTVVVAVPYLRIDQKQITPVMTMVGACEGKK
jgi:hypothetical protein